MSVNVCLDCNAIREYPDGLEIHQCPRCDGTNIQHEPSPVTQDERDALLMRAMTNEVKKL